MGRLVRDVSGRAYRMRLNKLHPRFGVEIIDANLLQMDAVTVESIRKAITRYGFVLFRTPIAGG